jgi:lipopolysaccharide biosynthesis protein
VHPLTALSEYRLACRAVWHFLNPGICSRRRILASDTRVHEPYQQDPSCAQGLERLCNFIVTSKGSTRNSLVYAVFPNLQLLAVNATLASGLPFSGCRNKTHRRMLWHGLSSSIFRRDFTRQ